jgi:hypothetical protein
MSKRKRQKQYENGAEIHVEQPIVACLIPCYKTPHPKMQHAFAAMTEYTRKAGAQMFSRPIIQSSVVHWTRNALLADLIKSEQPFTHVLFIDDDIVPGPDYLVRMLKHDKDIIAALCTRRQDPPIPNARLYNEEAKRYEELWEFPDGLVEVGAIGTGMMLLSRHALQQVMEIYLQCLHEKEIFGITKLLESMKKLGSQITNGLGLEWCFCGNPVSDGFHSPACEVARMAITTLETKFAEMQAARTAAFDEDANGWWFRFLECENGVGELGEDIGFCWAASKYAGLKIYADTTLQPEHMGDYGYAIKDFIEHRNPLIEDAKRKGRYLAPPSLLEPRRDKIQVVEG